ncbi:MAG TPA: hypothetical protein ENI75_00155 [Mizugakiibacter sp.]|nr:hypothetical protein [Mizugakiibacter sp.]
MTKLKMTTLAAALLGMGMASTAALASPSKVIDDNMTRRPAGSTSGSGDTVEANCVADPSGLAWQGATATLEIKQKGTGSNVEVEVTGAVPNTLFTVWVRIKGKNGLNPAGSPLTGGGATPMAPGSTLDALNAISPWVSPAGAASSANSFATDADGYGEFDMNVDFPVIRGAYPFQMTATSRPGHEGHANVATAIADPREPGQSKTPFLIRVVSHCTDNMSHGLSPATREAWFQYP